MIKEVREHPFHEITRLDYDDEVLKFKAPVLGTGQTSIIALTPKVMLSFMTCVPLETYKMQYNQYYPDNILLTVSLKGNITYEWGNRTTPTLKTRQSFLYHPQGEDAFYTVEKGKRFEQINIIFKKQDFGDLIDRFFDGDQKAEREKCINAIFSKSTKGTIFDISKDITIILRQILDCRLKGNFRKVYMECKLYEIMAHYLYAISSTHEHEIKFSASDVQKLQEVKQLLQGQDQIMQTSVDDLCKKVGLNRFKLTAGFQSIYSTSVIKFYHQSVLSKAMDELQENKKESISSIALKYGYGTSQAFSTAFYKQFGMRPSELRS